MNCVGPLGDFSRTSRSQGQCGRALLLPTHQAERACSRNKQEVEAMLTPAHLLSLEEGGRQGWPRPNVDGAGGRGGGVCREGCWDRRAVADAQVPGAGRAAGAAGRGLTGCGTISNCSPCPTLGTGAGGMTDTPRALGCWVLGSNNNHNSLAGTPPGLLGETPMPASCHYGLHLRGLCAADTEVPPHGLPLPRRLRLEEMTSLALESEHRAQVYPQHLVIGPPAKAFQAGERRDKSA